MVLFVRDLGCSHATGPSGMPSVVLLPYTWEFQPLKLSSKIQPLPGVLSAADAHEIWQDLLYHMLSSLCTPTALQCWSLFHLTPLTTPCWSPEGLAGTSSNPQNHHELGKGSINICWLTEEVMIKHEQYLIKKIHLRIFPILLPPCSPTTNWEARWINTKISEPQNQFHFTVSKHGTPPSSTHGSCYVCKWEGSAVKIQALEWSRGKL